MITMIKKNNINNNNNNKEVRWGDLSIFTWEEN